MVQLVSTNTPAFCSLLGIIALTFYCTLQKFCLKAYGQLYNWGNDLKSLFA